MILTHLVLFSFLGGAAQSEAAQPPVVISPSPGATRQQHVKFIAIRAAEHRLTGSKARVEVRLLAPYAGASATPQREVAYTRHGYFNARSGAIAAPGRALAAAYSGELEPEAMGRVVEYSRGVSFGRAKKLYPRGAAVAHAEVLLPCLAYVGGLSPYGIQNPTDEELAVLVVTLTRKRVDKNRHYA